MAGTRSRKTQASSSPESTIEPSDSHHNNRGDSKGRYSRNSRIPSINTPEDESSTKTSSVIEKSSTEIDSLSANANPTASEELSSNTSDPGSAGTSEKSSSETSVTSDETLRKTKEELIHIAHDLDAQMQDLIKM